MNAMEDKPQTRQARWRQQNPVAAWAHSATRSAVRRGLIMPQPCEECGGNGKVDAHHPDHRFPLQVKWLCRRCHKAEHKRMRGGA